MISTERPRGFGSDSPIGSGRARGSPQLEIQNDHEIRNAPNSAPRLKEVL